MVVNTWFFACLNFMMQAFGNVCWKRPFDLMKFGYMDVIFIESARNQMARNMYYAGTSTLMRCQKPVQIRMCFLSFFWLTPEAYILSMIGEEFNLWFPFAGRMHLCDFGRSIKDAPLEYQRWYEVFIVRTTRSNTLVRQNTCKVNGKM